MSNKNKNNSESTKETARESIRNIATGGDDGNRYGKEAVERMSETDPATKK